MHKIQGLTNTNVMAGFLSGGVGGGICPPSWLWLAPPHHTLLGYAINSQIIKASMTQ